MAAILIDTAGAQFLSDNQADQQLCAYTLNSGGTVPCGMVGKAALLAGADGPWKAPPTGHS